MKEPDLEEERLIASAKGLKLTIERRSMEDENVGRVQISAPGRGEPPRWRWRRPARACGAPPST